MEITSSIKKRIVAAMEANRVNYPSDSKHAQSLGISSAVYSQLRKGATERVLSEANWISMARRLGVELRPGMEWKAAKTATFKYIWAQLTACQNGSLSAIMCDMLNIGKTFTAREYVKVHKNAVYVDCGQVKTKTQLVKQVAKEFGVSCRGQYRDVYEDLVYYLKTVDSPLIILDEAGDLKNEAYLELKALWNATERHCAWYMMGADGLKARIERSVDLKMVGYTELLSRFGDRFCKVTPDDGRERWAFLMEQARVVAEANAPEGVDALALARKTGGALRRVYTEIEKAKAV